jgi:hypothetical protein
MPRLMSVAFTEAAVVARQKTVTRRKGWLMLKPGDRLTLCRKVMGRKKGEPLVRVAEVEVVSVTRERLDDLLRTDISNNEGEVAREGFPGMTPEDFIQRFFVDAQGMSAEDVVTRIEWRYLESS